MMAGADFIKTSTGKESVNATLPVSLVMMRAIRDYHERTGYRVGYKPAGGISTAKDSLTYLALLKEELGDAWLTPHLFRFGASSLLLDIERQLEHHVTGHYSAGYRPRHGPLELPCMTIKDIFDTMDWGTAPESDGEVQAWLEAHDRRFGLFIDGKWTAPGETFEARNPANGELLAEVTKAGLDDVNAAVAAARKAQVKWAAISGHATREIPLRARPAGPEAFTPARRARDAWTTASRSANPATSTCRWWRAISTTTPAGPS